jgi:arsenate reductase (glutaredoxin)
MKETPAMTAVTLYHNPRCSKSRAALALLAAAGVSPLLRLYLQDPPSLGELRSLQQALGVDARSLLRNSEEPYRMLKLDAASCSETELLEAIVAHPILLQRPIALAGKRAVIGRPPETVLELLA